MGVTLACTGAFFTDEFRHTPMGTAVAILLLIIGMLGMCAMLTAPARLLIGICRKSLSYEAHADAALVVLLECLAFLLANLHM